MMTLTEARECIAGMSGWERPTIVMDRYAADLDHGEGRMYYVCAMDPIRKVPVVWDSPERAEARYI